MKKQYFLSEVLEKDTYGTIWKVKFSDGPHDTKNGVIKAKQLIEGIFGNKNKEYVITTIESVPNRKLKVNKEAINSCKKMIEYAK